MPERNASISIVLADDHQVVRQGLKMLLDSNPDFEVIAEAADGIETVALVERTKPRVLVLDLVMPGLGGFEVIRRLTKSVPETAIVVLSIHTSDAHVAEALRLGATGYVLKSASANELTEAIRQASEGQRFLSAPFSMEAIDRYVQRAKDSEVDIYETLTDREREVLQMVAEGMSSPAMAERLGISPRTIETHRANVMRKLGLKGRTDLIRYAIRRGLVPIDEGNNVGHATSDDT